MPSEMIVGQWKLLGNLVELAVHVILELLGLVPGRIVIINQLRQWPDRPIHGRLQENRP